MEDPISKHSAFRSPTSSAVAVQEGPGKSSGAIPKTPTTTEPKRRRRRKKDPTVLVGSNAKSRVPSESSPVLRPMVEIGIQRWELDNEAGAGRRDSGAVSGTEGLSRPVQDFEKPSPLASIYAQVSVLLGLPPSSYSATRAQLAPPWIPSARPSTTPVGSPRPARKVYDASILLPLIPSQEDRCWNCHLLGHPY